jgi:hypothetical protein
MKPKPGFKPFELEYPGPHLIQSSGPPGSSFVIRNIPCVRPIAPDPKNPLPPAKGGGDGQTHGSGTDGGSPDGAGG